MRRTILAAALLAVPVALSPSTAVATTLAQLLAWCGSRDSGDGKLCDTYLQTALGLLRSPDPVLNAGHQVCAPPGDPKKTVVPLLAVWSKQNPGRASTDDSLPAMGEALIGRYPCK